MLYIYIEICYIYWNMASYLLEYGIIFLGICYQLHWNMKSLFIGICHTIYIEICYHIYWNMSHHIYWDMLSYLLE